MNENLDKLKRAIRYLFRPGNALYLGILAIILCLEAMETLKNLNTIMEAFQAQGVDPNCDPGTDIKCFTVMMEASKNIPANYGLTALKIIAGFLFLCKMFDGIQRISEGREDDPVPFAPVSLVPFLTPLKYIGGSILVCLITLPLALIASVQLWQFCLGLISTLFLPAMVMNLVGNDSVISMISPRAWLITINNMGLKNYLALLLFPLLVAFPLAFGLVILAALSGNEGLILISMEIAIVLAIALTYTYIGYFMRADAPQGLNDAELRVLHEADTYHMDDDAKKQFAQDLLAADTLQAEGSFDEMEALLLPYTSAPKNIAQYFPAWRRLYQHYTMHRRHEALPALEQRLIEAAAQGNERCYLVVRKAVEDMALDDPARLPADWIQPLARMAVEHHDYDIVLALTRNFAQRHPGHKHILDNYYCAARALDKKGEHERALHLLQQLIEHYPDHPKTAQVRRTLERLQQAEAGQNKTSLNKPH